jgi:hypothetical protein
LPGLRRPAGTPGAAVWRPSPSSVFVTQRR